jgi:aspartate/methionine/tyrosine aminotransferase
MVTKFEVLIIVVCALPVLGIRSLTRNLRNYMIPSTRVIQTERPHIEDVLDSYSGIPDLTTLALGSSYWNPPDFALSSVQDELLSRNNHRYGNILGFPPLRRALDSLLHQQGIDMEGMEVSVTAGANQGFLNVAMLLSDTNDNVIIVAPYYFSHLLSCQLCQANVHICPFDPHTLQPNWSILSEMVTRLNPKLVRNLFWFKCV